MGIMAQIAITVLLWELVTWGLRSLWYDYINKK